MYAIFTKRLHPLLRIFTNERLWLYFTLSAVFIFITAGILVSLNRYWQYEVFYYDFGIFDQAIWKASHFQAPTIEHLVVRDKVIFADHFNPSIFLLIPLYWLTSRQEIILIAQAVIVGLSGFIIFLTAREILKKNFFAFGITILYFLYAGLQNAVITDFHEITIAVLPLALVFYAIAKKRFWLYIVSLVVFLGCKESNSVVAIGIAFIIFFLQKEWRKVAIITAVASVLYGALAIGVIIPYFAKGPYQYGYNPQYDGKLYQLPGTLLDHPEKRRTIFYSLASFGFLPLFSPVFWFSILSDFYSRFYTVRWFTRWGLGFHYNAILAVILAISSIYGLVFLKKRITQYLYGLMCVLLLAGMIISFYLLRAPFALSYNKAFYQHTKDFAFLDQLLSHVPKNAKIMTQNNLATRLDHGKVMLLIKELPILPDDKKPDYIVLDTRPGQNPNNFFPFTDVQKFTAIMEKTGEYQVYYQQGEQIIYKRKKATIK